MDEESREFGRLETRVGQLEKESALHFETRRDYFKWKHLIIGITLILGQLIPLALWFVGKYF